MGFSRQEWWNGLPFPLPGDLPDPETDPGIEPMSPASPALVGGFFTTEPPGKLIYALLYVERAASGKLLYKTGSPAGQSVTTQRGGIGVGWEGSSRGSGGYIYIPYIHIYIERERAMTDLCCCTEEANAYKLIILQFKTFKKEYDVFHRKYFVSLARHREERI